LIFDLKTHVLLDIVQFSYIILFLIWVILSLWTIYTLIKFAHFNMVVMISIIVYCIVSAFIMFLSFVQIYKVDGKITSTEINIAP